MRRRLLAVLAGSLVLGAGWTVAPARVWAASNFSREVRFGPGGLSVLFLDDFSTGVTANWEACSTGWASNWTAGTSAYNGGQPGSVSLGTGDPVSCVKASVAAPVAGQQYTFGWYMTGNGAGAHRVRVGFCSNSSGNCTETGESAYSTSTASFAYYEQTLTAPAGAARFNWDMDGDSTVTMDHVFIRGVQRSATDCIGVGGLAWGASGLTSSTHSSWGDGYTTVYNGCYTSKFGRWNYTPPEGVGSGDTWEIGVAVASHGSVPCHVQVQTIDPAPTVPTVLLDFTYQGQNTGATGPGHWISQGDMGSGTTGITISANAYCVWQNIYIANVEGDPVLDVPISPDNPHSFPGVYPGDDDSLFKDCNAPANPLDVPGWLSFGACLVATGFQAVWASIASIPGDIADYLAADLAALGDLIGGAITAALSALFEPSDSAAGAWGAVLDEFGDKVPFGWFSQITDSVSAGLSAPAASVGSMSFTVLGADINAGDALDEGMGVIAPFRGLLFAGVALTMTLGGLHWIMAAVGVGKGSEDSE